MDKELNVKMYSFTLDAVAPRGLAEFYARLLGWDIVPIPDDADDEFVIIAPTGAGLGAYPGVTFQKNPAYVPPVWPEEPGRQQQMAHLDFAVNDVDKAVEYAVELGAAIAGSQFSEGWKVMLDPEGHPFCLCKGNHVFESPDFALQ